MRKIILVLFLLLSLTFSLFFAGKMQICSKASGTENKSADSSQNNEEELQKRYNEEKIIGSPWLSPNKPQILKLSLEPAEKPFYAGWEHGNFLGPKNAWINLHQTTDGGKTWQRVHITRKASKTWLSEFASTKDFVYSTYFDTTIFVNPKRGWLEPLVKFQTGLWQTDDGGITWKRISNEWAVFYFIDNQYGWMQITVPLDKEDYGNKVYLTKNGGDTWEPCGSIFDRHIDISVPYFLNPKIGWAEISAPNQKENKYKGFIYYIAKTEDGGCTWQKLWELPEHCKTNGEIYFLNEMEGWVIPTSLESVLNKTIDGGKSWKLVPLPKDKIELRSVYFISSNEGWIMDSDENVYHTLDGGQKWVQISKSEIKNGFPPRSSDGKYWRKGGLLTMLIQTE